MGRHREIDALLTELLDSGVCPKYVSRLAAELGDHCEDLEEEALRLGVSPTAAAADARMRLGRRDAIAREFAQRPELRSWVYTSCWLVAVLRALVGACLLLGMPARAVASGQAALLRYAAATAAGTSVTLALLLAMTTLLSGDGGWRARITAGTEVALRGWQSGRPLRPERRTEDLRGAGAADASSAGSAAEAAARGRSSAEPRADDSAPPDAEPRGQRFRGGAATPDDFGEPGAARSPPASPRPPAVVPPELQLAFAELPLVRLADAHAFAAAAAPSFGVSRSDGDFRPIVRAAPDYPSVAARRGIEGYVVVEYTVTRTGTVTEAVVVESSSTLFNRAALEAASGFKYKPRFIRGEPVDVRGVRTLIRFELEV